MNFLGVDVGTGGSRAVLINTRGQILTSAIVEHQPFTSLHLGWAEQDPNNWWQATAAAIRNVLANHDVRAAEISAIGFSGQMHGAVLLDESDRILRPALIWCDQRTDKQCQDLTTRIGAQRIIELTCNPAVTGFTLPKLLWTRENEPEIWQQVRSVLLPKDYVRMRLSGDKATDVADASGTLLFDVKRRCWSSEMFDRLDLNISLFPRVFESTEITGTVSDRGAAETGLLAGTPIVAGAGDNAAGAVGMGIVKAGMVSATIGTSGVIFAVTDQPTLDAKGRIHTLCHAVPNRWHLTGVTQGAGLSLKWFRDNFGDDQSYQELTALAATVSPGSDGAIWLPYLMGERTPHLDAKARAAFVGFTASHTKAHAVRAILEGVAFSLRDSIEIFRELKIPLEIIRLGGGGASSELWRRIQADVYGQTVETIEAEEGAAFGAAILAGVGAGAWKTVDEACEQTIRAAERIEPETKSTELLNRNYAAYKLLYAALRPAMKMIAEN